MQVLLTTTLEDTEVFSRSYGVATVLVQAAIAAIGRVHELPLKLAGLQLDNITIDPELLRQQLFKHMCTQVLSCLRLNGVAGGSLLGSLDIFGDVGKWMGHTPLPDLVMSPNSPPALAL